MTFTTKLNIPKQETELSYKMPFFLLGSCFTENIGNKLLQKGFNVNINPFGILYNPISLANCLDFVIHNKRITENDVFFNNELWHSYYHHGNFSQIRKEDCLHLCNEKIIAAHAFLKTSEVVILTFGSAWIYNLKELDITVANCHKLPASCFDRKLVEVPDIVALYKSCFQKLKDFNPSIKIILTVSPVRHWKEGYRQNQISKSVLHLAIYELQKTFEDILYFPAYEIMMDELRDYRFYDTDFLHPNALAVNYIWDVFSNTFFSEETLSVMEKLGKLKKMLDHKPFQPITQAWKNHTSKTNQILSALKKEYPEVDFSNLTKKDLGKNE